MSKQAEFWHDGIIEHMCVLIQHSLHTHLVWVLIHSYLTQPNAFWTISFASSHCAYLHLPGQCHHLTLASLPILDLLIFQDSIHAVLFPLKPFLLSSIMYNLPSSVIVLNSTLFIVLYSNALYLFMHIYWFNKHLFNAF